ncbi:MAG TPA: (Fe-S)-binding protein, partial [Polyangiaceae bacterium]
MNWLSIHACLGLLLGSFALGLLLQLNRLFRGTRHYGNSDVGKRGGWRRLLEDGVMQRGLRRRPSAGTAHQAILYGFVLLLPRWVMLIGRAFRPGWGALSERDGAFWFLLIAGYQSVKSLVTVMVLLAVAWFVYARLTRREPRLTPNLQAMAILSAIAVMLLADLTYDAAGMALLQRPGCVHVESTACHEFAPLLTSMGIGGCWDPITRGLATALSFINDEGLRRSGTIAYWLHVLVGAAFLAALPYGKHLHVLAAWPNLYLDRPLRSARLTPVASSAEALLTRVEAAMLGNVAGEAASTVLGKACLADFSAKERLDWLACSACGRCTEHCPATASGQSLDPMRVVQAFRAHLQATPLFDAQATKHLRAPLVPAIIQADALWACTACGACEEQCPVAVRTIAPMLEMRRDLLMMRGEAPNDLLRLFDGIQRRHNPYQRPQQERAAWADALLVPRLADVESVQYLYWVGCAASYDARAQAVARALVELMRRAGVTFAILGSEERCTGDVARRAGNELLFLELAEHNIRTLSRYRSEKRFERIITTCPHCQLTLTRDYADLGATFEVVPHVVAIEQWVSQGRLVLAEPDAEARSESFTYHDPCTLARYADVTREPRRLIDAA